MKSFCADFETTTDESDCRVWAYAISEIGNVDNFIYGNSIDEFMEWCANTKENYKIYFHNLKFDGSFILDWLERTNFEFIADRKDAGPNTYATLITDMGVFYSITVYFDKKGHKTNKVVFYDSQKILNISVEQVAKDFNLPIHKLTLDYKGKREIGHKLTQHEIDYIRNDVEIMSQALQKVFEQGLTKMTIGSDALNYYKTTIPNFNKIYPQLDPVVNEFVRKSYKGGFTYLNPKYKEKQTGEGIVLDVNSMYPSMMYERKLPFGIPVEFDGEYQYDPVYDLYIINFACRFELKPGKIPSIQLKHTMDFQGNEYLESSNGLNIEMWLTSVDYELFKENYYIYEPVYAGGYKFKSAHGLFKDYIDFWINQKIKSKKEKNYSMTKISKLMLNSCYGKFGLSTRSVVKQPYMTDDGVVKYNLKKEKDRKMVYTAMASFITSYGRQHIISTSQKIRDWSIKKYGEDYYVYSDTDSIHMRVGNIDEDINELKQIIEIDDYKLNAWALEGHYKRGSYIRQKSYVEEDFDGKLNVTIAGFPKYLAPVMRFDDFVVGYSIKHDDLTVDDLKEMARQNGATDEEIERVHHKLRFKHVPGGVILADTDFTIKT